MNEEERKAFELWIEYCRKLKKWYAANPEKAAEYEPIMMMPPFDAIVESNLAADAELTRLRGQITAGRECNEMFTKENKGLREAVEWADKIMPAVERDVLPGYLAIYIRVADRDRLIAALAARKEGG